MYQETLYQYNGCVFEMIRQFRNKSKLILHSLASGGTDFNFVCWIESISNFLDGSAGLHVCTAVDEAEKVCISCMFL